MSMIGSYVDNTFITGTSDADSIRNSGNNVSISTGDGNDTVYNVFSMDLRISLGAGDDSISDERNHRVTIDAGTGNDYIEIDYSNNVSIDAGEGKDYVYSNGKNLNLTISGGKGDDTFSNYQGIGSVYLYKAGDGNDVIFGFDGDDTLLITGGSWSKATVGPTVGPTDVVITVGKDQITLKRASTLSAVNITSSAEEIHPVTTIQSTQTDKLLTGTNYRDSVYNFYPNVTINTADGEDSIDNGGDSVKVDMGAGDDLITNSGDFVTITSGKGNDSIDSSGVGNVYVYSEGDGNDLIHNYNPSDTISLTGGSVENALLSGNDLLLLTNNGAIRLVDTRAVNVNGTIYGEFNTEGTSGDDEITNFTAKVNINALGGNDKISNGGAEVSINTGTGYNTISNYGENATIKTGSGENIIYNYASATVQGSAGNDSVKLYGKAVTLNAGDGDDYIDNDAASISIDAGAGDDTVNNSKNYVQIKLGDGNDSLENYNANQFLTIDGGAGNDSISGQFNSSFIDGGTGDDIISLTSDSEYGSFGNTVRGGKGNDTIYRNSVSSGVLYEYADGDGYDVIENFNANDTLSIVDTGDFSTLERGLDIIVTVGKGAVTLKNAANIDRLNVVSKIIKLTGNNVEYDNSLSGATVSSSDGNDIIYNNQADSVSINSGAGDDSLKNYYGDLVTIEAGAGDDSLFNEHGDDSKINAGAGNDYISNAYSNNVSINAGAGNDYVDSYDSRIVNVTMNGGTGDDTIYGIGVGNVYTYKAGDGNDFIRGFNEDDTVLITDGTWSTATIDSDVFIMVGKGVLTLKDAASLPAINVTSSVKDIHPVNLIKNYKYNTLVKGTNYRDSITNGGSNVSINTGEGNDTIWNTGSSVTITGGNGNDYIENLWSDAYKVSINGGKGNDTISNSSSEVTLGGGKGNDSIILSDNATKNVIQYAVGDGYDTVYNYNPSSMVSLTGGSVKSASVSDNDLVLKTKSGSIRFVNTHAVNVNGTIYGEFNTTGTNSDDVITNFADKAKINGKGGNDSISNGAANVSINTGDGFNIVKNYGANATIKTGSGRNYIYNYANATVQGNVGNDSVNLYGEKISMNAGAGNDFIYNAGDTVTIDAGAGNDKVYNYGGKHTKIKLGDGNDSLGSYVYYSNQYSTVDGGAGNDTINGKFYYSSIDGGAGNDNISLMGTGFWGNTINGGKGNDTIYNNVNNGTLYQYVKGDGNDLIYNVSPYDTLSIAGSSYTTSTSGNDLLVSVKDSGTITLVSAGSADIKIISTADVPVTIEPGEDISNSDDKNSITSGAGDDTITNSGKKVKINSGDGNDIVTNNESAESTSMYTGKGNDSIKNIAINSSINAGVGNDKIQNTAQKVSINAGTGNDLIVSKSDYVTVLAGAGKDTITGDYYRSKISGDNDKDFISISSFWYNTVAGGTGNDKIYAGGNEHSISGGSGNDLISLTGDHLTINGGKGNDTIYGSTATSHLYQYKSGDGNDLIFNVGTHDTLMLNGITANEWSSVKSGNNLIVKIGTLGNITLVGGKANKPKIYSADSVPKSDDKETAAQTVIKDFMKTLAATKNSGITALSEAVSVATGGYFTNINFAVNQMISDRENSTGIVPFMQNYCGIVLNNDDTGAITGSDAGTLTTKTKESIVKETGKLDTKFNADSFTTKNGLTFHLYNNFNKLSDDEKYMWRALKTWWADKSLELIKESYDYSFNDADTSVKDITVQFVTDPRNYLAGTGDTTTINGIKTRTLVINKLYYNNFSNSDKNGISPSGRVYLDRTIAHELTHTMMMEKVDSFWELPEFIIEGTAELTHGIDDVRTFDAMDALSNTSNLKDALSFLPWGDKSDSYAAGYIFMRYLAKQGAEHYPTNSDLTSGFNNMSVAYSKAADSKAVTVKNQVLTVAKDFTGTEVDLTKYAADVKKVNASKFGKGVMIFGNTNASSMTTGAGNDTIFANAGKDTLRGGAGKDILSGEAGNDKIYGGEGNDKLFGGTGNDSLIGGKGNDSLWGNNGKDTFIYSSGDGKDTIYGFENDDMLKITGAFSGTYSKSKGEVYFKVGSTSKAITLCDFSATSFNVNGTAYKIKGSKLVEK